MKKIKLHTLFYSLSILLILGFGIKTTIDYFKYDSSYSSPFYITIILNTIYYIVPSIIYFVTGRICKKKIN